MAYAASDSYRNVLRHQGQDYSFAPRYLRGRDPIAPQNLSPDIKPKEQQGYYPTGSFWTNTTNGNLWVLQKIANNLANWILLSSGTNGPILSITVPNGVTEIVPVIATGEVTFTSNDNSVTITGSSAAPNNNNIDFSVTAGTHPIESLSDDVGTKVDPDETGNIQLEGRLNEQSGGFFSTVVATAPAPASAELMINPMSGSRWIVDPLSTTTHPNGTHTTIGAALTSASSGDTILVMPGTYTENLTLKAGVNMVAYRGDATTPNVSIVGKATATFAGSASISNIRLTTNSDNAVVVSGSNATILRLHSCFLNCLNNTAISYSSSSSSSSVVLSQCGGDLGSMGAIFAQSSTGTLAISYSSFANTGGSTTANTASAGALSILHSTITNPITTSSTNVSAFEFSDINTGAINTTCLMHGGASTSNHILCDFASGTATAITIGSGLNLANCTINSSNTTSAISGAGTLAYEGLFFTANGFNITTSTQTGGIANGSTAKNPTQTFIGETISNTATAVAATSNTPLTIASIMLTPGVWDVTCIAGAQASGGTVLLTALVTNLSTTNNTIVGTIGIDTNQMNVGGSVLSGSVPPIRKLVTATMGNTTYYLVCNVIYTSTSASVNGRINATRVG